MPNIRLRRDTAANWTASDPTLLVGEVGLETDTDKWKYGDGVTAWTALNYQTDTAIFNADKLQGDDINPAISPADGEVLTWVNASSHWDSQPAAGGGGGLTITRQNSAYNAVNGDLISCDVNAVGSFIVTLNASPSDNDVVGVYLETGSGSNTVTIARNGNTIGGQAADQTLYVGGNASNVDRGDYLELQYDNTASDWVIKVDGLIAHTSRMYKDPGQTISAGASTKVNYDNTVYNIGNIADPTTNNRFDIRRAGTYTVIHNLFLGYDSGADTSRAQIYIDGVRTRESRISGPGTVTAMGPTISADFYLTAGQYIEGWALHDDSPSFTTYDSAFPYLRPEFFIKEIR